VRKKGHQALAYTTISTKELWHQRYGHLNYNDFLLIQKHGMVEGLPLLKNEQTIFEGCALGK
jgi:hypothetical protein